MASILRTNVTFQGKSTFRAVKDVLINHVIKGRPFGGKNTFFTQNNAAGSSVFVQYKSWETQKEFEAGMMKHRPDNKSYTVSLPRANKLQLCRHHETQGVTSK